MRKLAIVLSALGVLAVILGVWLHQVVREREERAANFFPFHLPYDDSSETVVSLAHRLHKPAGKYGHVYVGPDGHLYVGGERIRFLGVNIVAEHAFPTKRDAEIFAARLAKFGVNIVRFHHLDAAWLSFNIFQPPGTRRLNPVALDRLDYLIAKLKEQGIYVNLNLLVSRRLRAADGLPPEIEQVDWKDQQILGFFMDEVRELQKEYARQLLTHRNPYTNMTYAEDPAVAFVEIVNEFGLIHAWLDGVVDRLPEVFKRPLQEKWNAWLRAKYGDTARLVEAWGGETKLGEEVLANPRFERGTLGWVFERHGAAQATYDFVDVDGMRALRVRVTRRGEGWHVQFNYPRIRVREGEIYRVTFTARAEAEAYVTVCLRQAHEPWQAVSQVVTVKLTPEWRTYEVILGVGVSDDNARLDISNLGALETTYYFANFSMRPYQGAGLKEGESLEEGTVSIFKPGDFFGRSPAARRDWAEFLWSLERDYFLDMYRYLKEELGVKALVIGTIAGCSTPVIMSELDVVDTHAYWMHPAFPGTPWDPRNWYVVNEPMVNNPLGSTITWLASRRVLGKPFTVTEYNHPAPNMYDSETYVILSAYAALQDWDGIFAFSYDGLVRDARRIVGFFDVSQNPQKMATLILAHNIFVRGDVEPARELVTMPISRETEINLLVGGKLHAWNLPGAHHLGWSPATPLVHRFALNLEGTGPSGPMPPEGQVYKSDNGQVVWDCSTRGKCVLLINSPRTVAVVGFGAGRRFDFDGVTIEPAPSLLNFSVIGVTSMDGEPIERSRSMLLVAIGYIGNNGMELREYATNRLVARVTQLPQGYTVEINPPLNVQVTCGDNWGPGPTIAEGVRARIRVKGEVEVWALDNTGRRREKLPTTVEGGWTVFEIGPGYRTIWYEISRP
ncbi:MAG: carbohydrate binding domain-containing protein [Thermofilaceae archaeon]